MTARVVPTLDIYKRKPSVPGPTAEFIFFDRKENEPKETLLISVASNYSPVLSSVPVVRVSFLCDESRIGPLDAALCAAAETLIYRRWLADFLWCDNSATLPMGVLSPLAAQAGHRTFLRATVHWASWWA